MNALIRPMSAGDVGYVISTWVLQSWPWRGRKETATRRAQRDMHRASVEALVRHARVVVACSPEHPTALHGWAAADNGKVLFAYVPPQLVRAGFDIRPQLQSAVLELV